jgi:hypothetical protein
MRKTAAGRVAGMTPLARRRGQAGSYPIAVSDRDRHVISGSHGRKGRRPLWSAAAACVPPVIHEGSVTYPGQGPPISTMHRIGRLETPSMPVSNSALPARPPQPSWRTRPMRTRSAMPRRCSNMCASLEHAVRAAAVTADAQEPRRKRAHRLPERLLVRGQRIGAVASPGRPGVQSQPVLTSWDWAGKATCHGPAA